MKAAGKLISLILVLLFLIFIYSSDWINKLYSELLSEAIKELIRHILIELIEHIRL